MIRPATPDDLPSMMAIEETATSAAHWSREQYQQIFNQATPSRLALILEENQTLHGFLVGKAVVDEWEIENIVIESSSQRRGFGTQLVAEFLNIARAGGGKALFLEVRESNLAARHLYEKSGFKQSTRRRRYYHDPEEDALLYRLDIA